MADIYTSMWRLTELASVPTVYGQSKEFPLRDDEILQLLLNWIVTCNKKN